MAKGIGRRREIWKCCGPLELPTTATRSAGRRRSGMADAVSFNELTERRQTKGIGGAGLARSGLDSGWFGRAGLGHAAPKRKTIKKRIIN